MRDERSIGITSLERDTGERRPPPCPAATHARQAATLHADGGGGTATADAAGSRSGRGGQAGGRRPRQAGRRPERWGEGRPL